MHENAVEYVDGKITPIWSGANASNIKAKKKSQLLCLLQTYSHIQTIPISSEKTFLLLSEPGFLSGALGTTRRMFWVSRLFFNCLHIRLLHSFLQFPSILIIFVQILNNRLVCFLSDYQYTWLAIKLPRLLFHLSIIQLLIWPFYEPATRYFTLIFYLPFRTSSIWPIILTHPSLSKCGMVWRGSSTMKETRLNTKCCSSTLY